MAADNEITREGYERLNAELQHLETVARREIADAILEARGHGDLSENAEYHAAKDEQAHLEARIARLREHLLAVRVVDAGSVSKDRIGVGSRVPIRYDDGDTESYQVVGTAEASPEHGRFSSESPIGRALLGATAGQTVTVQAPGGAMKVTVVSIDAG